DPNRRLTWGGVDWTPLALALFHRNVEDVETLLTSGANPNARWCVPLRSHQNERRAVAEAGCDSSAGTTPLMLAVSLGNPDFVELLLKHGADRTLRDWRGRTAVEYAAK